MKKILFIIMSVAILSFFSCRRASHNGKIDGNWLVTSIELKADGNEIPKDTVIYPQTNMLIAIQLELFQMTPNIGNVSPGIIDYDKSGHKLVVDFPNVTSQKEMDGLKRFGIYSNPESFDVTVDNRSLILTTDVSVISCKRF